jgi:serine-type D-Ala-D-Ala carboxypeptidase/endopeptidase
VACGLLLVSAVLAVLISARAQGKGEQSAESGIASSSVARAPEPSVAEIHRLLVDRIETQKRTLGIVVGIIDVQGPRIVACGRMQEGDSRALNGDTIFEIGSVTKVFTALLLADMEQRGEVRLDDPIAMYLSSASRLPERDGHGITLLDLVTNTSGLPQYPTNFDEKDAEDPFAHYTERQLYAFLGTYQLKSVPGTNYTYSNIGFGLLGFILTRRAGLDYGELVQQRILRPLGLRSTSPYPNAEMARRLATGYSPDLVAAPRWSNGPVMQGAGDLRSSARDLLRFLAAAMGEISTPLAPAFKILLSVKRPTDRSSWKTAMGWTVAHRGNGDQLVFKNGDTAGFASFVGYDPRSGTGVVVLSNSSDPVDDLGLHLLDSGYPVAALRSLPREVKVAPEQLARYVGRYELGPNNAVILTLDGDQLFMQPQDWQRVKLFPEGSRDFFLIDGQRVDRVSFQSDAHGDVTGLIIHEDGHTIPAKRSRSRPSSRP